MKFKQLMRKLYAMDLPQLESAKIMHACGLDVQEWLKVLWEEETETGCAERRDWCRGVRHLLIENDDPIRGGRLASN